MTNKTLGEIRVRTEFNPSKDSKVDQIKQKTAELINLCEDLRSLFLDAEPPPTLEQLGELKRLVTQAQDYYEIAAMFAVKAATSSK